MNGQLLALIGAALATTLACVGSAKGVGISAQAAMGVLSEDSSKFGKMMVLALLPGTQGLYGFIVSFLILTKCIPGFGGTADLTMVQGLLYLVASLPIAFGGMISAFLQGKAAVSGISLVAKDGDAFGKAMTQIALVEFYALLSLIISLLAVLFI